MTQAAAFRGQNGASETELFRQAGGDVAYGVDGRTSWYRASVPSLKATWALNELARVLTPRTITPELLDAAKRELLARLGSGTGPRPSDFLALLLQGYFVPPEFSESEFGIVEPWRSPEALRLHLSSLRAEQVQNHFARHYTPSNMVLFIAGPLKKKEMMTFLRYTYGATPDRGRQGGKTAELSPRGSPYLRSRLASAMPSVAVGTKFQDLSSEEEMVMRAYLRYLAHRLNATVFARQPETERAQAEVSVDALGFGYGRIRFHAPAGEYSRLRTVVESQIDAEAREGQLSDREIAQTTEYFLSDLEKESEGSQAMLEYAHRYFAFRSLHQTEASPFETLLAIRPPEFRALLAKVFAEDRRYALLEEPPLLFDGERELLLLLAAALTFWAWRRTLRRDFRHTAIRYVRRIRYGFLLCLFLATGFSAILWLLLQAGFLVDRILFRWTFFQSTYLLNDYLHGVIGTGLMVSFGLGFLCWFPRKLMVVGDELVFKTLTYYSMRFPLSEIKEVYVLKPMHVFRHRLWGPALRILHWAPWRKGLLIRFRDGSGFYLGFRDTDEVGTELREVLERLRPRQHRTPHHQVLRFSPRKE